MIKRKPLAACILAAAFLSGCSANNPGEPPASSPPQSPEAAPEQTRLSPEQLPEALLQGNSEQVYNQFSEPFKEQITLEDFQALSEEFHQDMNQYHHASTLSMGGSERFVWTDEEESRGLTAVFGPDNEILGLQVLMLQNFPETDKAYSSTEFRLPFNGEWLTVWGGTNELVNYHYAYPPQRYAIDWIITRDGQSFEGDPTQNESYYAFGEEVLAPAAGMVVAVENSIADNPVGEMNPAQPEGNYVTIDHGNGEFSVLAHFQQNSIAVAVGDTVEAGDLLGLCGNSGNSSEPHIHFHVVDSLDANANSIRIHFTGSPEIMQGVTVTAE